MKVLRREQILPISLEEAWHFFSSPFNLNKITPEDMHFKILNELPDKVYPGLMIHYKVSPLLRIPLDWTTEITHVKELSYFVDEQRKGPYRVWHHEHHFEARDQGVLMRDILHYDVGKWIFGKIAAALFVDAKVKAIFDYREQKLRSLFNSQETAFSFMGK